MNQKDIEWFTGMKNKKQNIYPKRIDLSNEWYIQKESKIAHRLKKVTMLFNKSSVI